MNDEEGYGHGDDHGDEHHALQDAEDEGKRAYHLGKHNHPEGDDATQSEGVGKEVGHRSMQHQFGVSVREEEESEQDADDENEGRVGAALVKVSRKDEVFECHAMVIFFRVLSPL